MQITGAAAVLNAIQNEEDVKLVLVDRSKDCSNIISECNKRGIPVEEGSTNDLWRMSADGQQDALALIGREPKGSLEEIFKRDGAIWLFDGVEYATNLGFAIRTAEVSGATAVIINVEKSHTDRRTIRRAGMRATRFIPVVYASNEEVLSRCNRRIIVAEDIGEKGPWDSDLTGDVLLVVGAENEGVSSEILEAADDVVKLPMLGFVPSYNLQVAVSALAIERLRQCENMNG
ncbi:MAG: TrmH family RNA methyltransferase [Candidatus Poseidoniaceae archaeon]|jgi:tRNA G18 (ribose-2'-O)-methylase SpoU|nr:TrmH family RNA methyltransferase [Candidatus Poseidoniaceae archaeon]